MSSILSRKGFQYLFRRIRNHLLFSKSRSINFCQTAVLIKIGLEIGGPSSIFSSKGQLPVYQFADRIDNCNFSSETIWEGKISKEQTLKYEENRSYGRQYFLEAADLNQIPSNHYDFILPSHVIEYVATLLKLYMNGFAF